MGFQIEHRYVPLYIFFKFSNALVIQDMMYLCTLWVCLKTVFWLDTLKTCYSQQVNIKYLDQFLGKLCSVIVWKKGLKITFMLIKLNVSQRKSLSDLCVTRKLAWCMFACMLKLHADIREILSLGNINCEIPLWNSVTLCRLCIFCLSNQGSCILHNYRFTDYLVEKRKVHLGKHWCM